MLSHWLPIFWAGLLIAGVTFPNHGESAVQVPRHIMEEHVQNLANKILYRLRQQQREKLEALAVAKGLHLLLQLQDMGNLHNYSSPIDNRIFDGMEITASLEEYHTLAIGVDYSSKQIAVAANIHSLDLDPALPQKYYRVKDVGFKASDMGIIRKVALEDPNFVGFSFQWITPLHEDRGTILTTQSLPGIPTRTFRASRQVEKYLSAQNMSRTTATILSSTFSCYHCFHYLLPEARSLMQDKQFGSVKPSSRRTLEPWVAAFEQITVTEVWNPENDTDIFQDDFVDPDDEEKTAVQLLEQHGGKCGFGSRQRRSLCSKLKDFTGVDCDQMVSLLPKLPIESKNLIMAAIDSTGIDKLFGSVPAVEEILKAVKMWKSDAVIKAIEMVKNGNLITGILDGALTNGLLNVKFSLNLVAESIVKQFPKIDEIIPPGLEKVDDLLNKGNQAISGVLNLATTGKNLVDGVMKGNWESVIQSAQLLSQNKFISKLGSKIQKMVPSAALKTFEKASKTVTKVVGYIQDSNLISVGVGVYQVVGRVSDMNSTKEECKKKDNLFQQRFEKNCGLRKETAIANLVHQSVKVALDVVTFALQVATWAGACTGIGGLVVGIIDAVFAVGMAIFNAVQTVRHIASYIDSGLSGGEAFEIGIRAFFGMDPPKYIQDLMNQKASYNYAVAVAANYLDQNEHFSTFVGPTTHRIDVNCRQVKETHAGRWFSAVFSFGFSELHHWTKTVCDGQEEFDEHSHVDFRRIVNVREFRVRPDRPSRGQLECFPNALPFSDPWISFLGARFPTPRSFLCINVIALTYGHRQNKPALFALRSGNDKAYGFPKKQNIFLIDSGHKEYVGGIEADSFFLNSYPPRGFLDGGGSGENTLYFPDYINADVDIYLGRNIHGYNIVNIQQVIGRRGQRDRIIPACDTKFIDLQGGSNSSQMDQIDLNAGSCEAQTRLVLHNFTLVSNNHSKNGQFVYDIKFGGQISVEIQLNGSNKHVFLFENSVVENYLSFANSKFSMRDSALLNVFETTYAAKENFLLRTHAGLIFTFDNRTQSFFGLGVVETVTKNLQGLKHYPNRFFISNDTYVFGGDLDDIFTFRGSQESNGMLDGGDGMDLLVFEDSFHNNSIVLVNLESKILKVPDQVMFGVESVELILGRKGLPDHVVSLCTVEWIDLGGGNTTHYDAIIIPAASSCSNDTRITIPPFTTLKNSAHAGTFLYNISTTKEEAEVEIFVDMATSSARHNYYFPKKIDQVVTVEYEPAIGHLRLQFDDKHVWTGRIAAERSQIILTDSMKIQVVPEIYGILQTQESIHYNVTGLHHYPNWFLLGPTTAKNQWNGGFKDDSFVILTTKFGGAIDGHEGQNTIVLSDDMKTTLHHVVVHFRNGFILFNTTEGINTIDFKNIHVFLGLKDQPETVFAACGTSFVDTLGGLNKALYDFIGIPLQSECAYTLKMVLRPNLIIENRAMNGNFFYEGDFRGGDCLLYLTHSEFVTHNITLSLNFEDVGDMWLEADRVLIQSYKSSSLFSVNFVPPTDGDYHEQPVIFFDDGLQLRISKFGQFSTSVFGTLDSSTRRKRDLDEGDSLIERYQQAAKRARTNVVMLSNDGELISIGSGQQMDIITAVPGFDKNILVSNGATDSVFRVAADAGEVIIIQSSSEQENVLIDLSPILSVDQNANLTTFQDNDNLYIQVGLVQIRVQYYMSMQDTNSSLKVLLDQKAMEVKCDAMECNLSPPPDMVDKDSLVIFSHSSLAQGSRIVLNDSEPGSYEFVRHKNHLILTNVFEEEQGEARTVVIYGYYEKGVAEELQEKGITFSFEGNDTLDVNLDFAMAEKLETFQERYRQSFVNLGILSWIFPVFVLMATVAAITLVCLASKKWNKNVIVLENATNAASRTSIKFSINHEDFSEQPLIPEANGITKESSPSDDVAVTGRFYRGSRIIVTYYEVPRYDLGED